MTAIFVPIIETWRHRHGLVALGAARLDGDVEPIAAPISEMDAPTHSGDVEMSVTRDGQLALRATIRDPVAAKKVATRVYRGFSLIVTGSRIERIALVDRPDFDKAAGRPEPALLKLVNPMASKASRYAAADRDLQQAERRLAALRTTNPTDAAKRLEMLHRVGFTRQRLAENAAPRIAISSTGKATMMSSPTTPTQPERQGTLYGRGGVGVDLGEPGYGRGDDAALSVVRDALSQPMDSAGLMRFLNRYADH